MERQGLDTQSFSLAEGKEFLNGGNVQSREVIHPFKKGEAQRHKIWTILTNILQILCPCYKQVTTPKNLKK